MDSSNDADLKREITKKVKSANFRSKDDTDDLQMTPGDKLCEDELTVIFSNSWISPQDLLNFRLVSKSWRDAATATLIQRDALVVELYEDSNSNRAPPCFYKNRRWKKTLKNKLSQLTKLISNSKKFPSTNFRIQTSPDTFTPYTSFPDLMHFFKLHGHWIKTLRPHSLITRKRLLDILLIYVPTLEHLDLSKARITALSEENALEWTTKTLPFKSLTIRECYPDYSESSDNRYEDRDFGSYNEAGRDLLHLLLSSPSKLCSIRNVTLQTLQMVLTEGKGHLIRSFKYTCNDEYLDSALNVVTNKFLTLNPTISKVALDLSLVCCGPSPVSLITSVNSFIQSFKDIVQNLNLSFRCNELRWPKLWEIPPMKKLKSLTLTIKARGRDMCEVRNEDIEPNIDLRGSVFQFEDRISAQNYFPSLKEVSLHSNESSGYPDVSLLNFFLFKSDTNGSSANWNCLPKVDILSVTRSHLESGLRLEDSCQSPAETPLISEVFPNIRILKFRCGKACNLSGALWAVFPNVEFMGIYGIRSFSTIGFGRFGIDHSHYVDEAFTGITDKMLENRRRWEAELFCKADGSDKLKLALTAPSITDLRHLRELKLNFVGKWSTEFASPVTGLHAFSKMPNTKFIISYDPENVLGMNQDRASHSNDDDGDQSANNTNGNIQVSDDVNNEDEKAGQENNDGGGNDDGQNKIVEYINDGSGCKGNGDDKIAEYEELIFGAIKPYVRIVHEKQSDDTLNW